MKRSTQQTSLRLPPLTDAEYSDVQALASQSLPLDECPTCRAKPIRVGPNVFGWEPGSYNFRGRTFECDCVRQMLLRKHYLKANIGDQYQRLNWADYDGDPKFIETVESYLDHWQNHRLLGMGLTIFGNMGSGKTFGATHIGKELIKQGEDVWFIPFINMIGSFQKPNSDEIETRLQQVSWLIMDELQPADSGPQSLLFSRRFEELLRHRTNFNLPTIITTNLNEKELRKNYERVYSVLSAKQINIQVKGDDARLGKINFENQELAEANEVAPIT